MSARNSAGAWWAMAALALAAVLACDVVPPDGAPQDEPPTQTPFTASPAPSQAPSQIPPPAPLVFEHVQPVGPRGLHFEGQARGRSYRIVLASHSNTAPYRRPLAFARLAHALRCGSVVAETRAEHIPIRHISRWFQNDPRVVARIRRDAQVSHNGTIGALLQRRIEGEAVAFHSPLVRRLLNDLAGFEPVEPADRRLLRDLSCALVLDYLAGHAQRTQIQLDLENKRIWLTDNGHTFPGIVEAGALDRALRRLAACRRFPADLFQSLLPLNRHRLVRELAPHEFVADLLGPRQRADIDDRRMTVLTLLDARRQSHGEAAAFSL